MAPGVYVFVRVVLILFVYLNRLFIVVAACDFNCFEDNINKLFTLLADHRYF